MLVDDLIARLEAGVAPLAGRIHGAAELSELVKRQALPQSPVFAFVLPLGLSARGEGECMTGGFIQQFDATLAVVLGVRAAGDPSGSRALPTIDELIEGALSAVCGRGPDDAIGVWRLMRGELLSAADGVVLYQLDFGLRDELRIVG